MEVRPLCGGRERVQETDGHIEKMFVQCLGQLESTPDVHVLPPPKHRFQICHRCSLIGV